MGRKGKVSVHAPFMQPMLGLGKVANDVALRIAVIVAGAYPCC